MQIASWLKVKFAKDRRRIQKTNKSFSVREMPPQTLKSKLTKEQAIEGLKNLNPEAPWCHYYDLGNNVHTISPDQERYMGKAHGLRIIGEQICAMVPYITSKATTEGLSVLDLACAEGIHSIIFAEKGANVKGLEGRDLYVNRASFAAKAFGLDNVSFESGDVRRITPEKTGTYDLVLFNGILHHLGKEDFFPMLKALYSVTNDTVFIYTHVATSGSIDTWDLRGPVTTSEGFSGYAYKEHPENATAEEKQKRLRSSLDNTWSFWANEDELLNALKQVGFKFISKVMHPHAFANVTNEHRLYLVCRK